MDYKCMKKCLGTLVVSFIVASQLSSLKAGVVIGKTASHDHMQQIIKVLQQTKANR